MKINFDASGFRADTLTMIEKLRELDKTLTEDVEKSIVSGMTDQLLIESVKRTPIDEGFLIASQEKKVVQEDGGYAGYVYIPSNSPGAPYAMYIHEGEYKLGKNSQMKQLGQSEIVGRKFLERAFYENIAKFERYVTVRLRRFFSDGK